MINLLEAGMDLATFEGVLTDFQVDDDLDIRLWYDWKSDFATPFFPPPPKCQIYFGLPGPARTSTEANKCFFGVYRNTPDTATWTLHARSS